GGGQQAGRIRHTPRRRVRAHGRHPPHRRRPARGCRVAGRALGRGHQLRRADGGQLAHPHRPGPPRHRAHHPAGRVPPPARRRLPPQRPPRRDGGDEPRRADRGPGEGPGRAHPRHGPGGLPNARRLAGREDDLHRRHRLRNGDAAGRIGRRACPQRPRGAAHGGDRALAGRTPPVGGKQPGQHRHRPRRRHPGPHRHAPRRRPPVPPRRHARRTPRHRLPADDRRRARVRRGGHARACPGPDPRRQLGRGRPRPRRLRAGPGRPHRLRRAPGPQPGRRPGPRRGHDHALLRRRRRPGRHRVREKKCGSAL
ncbi:MAG: hypothetical protein AVDCRST_MAG89-1471, partial [uncultured Gemmatimonadetes bacterium]